LCALHYDGGNSVNITFGEPAAAASPLAYGPATPLSPTDGPGGGASLFGPITSWQTAPNGLPLMNSLPTAPAAIFLDFDGDTGTSTTAYSEDPDSATYNATEQANIVEAWRHVSAYFAMFHVNVTTQMTALPKAWSIVGNNAGGATGGYAYVNTFPGNGPTGFNTSSNARTRQSGITHEIGHIFGLQHQSGYDLLGNKTTEYVSAADPLHGALMGVDFSGTVHKWFIGHGANSPSTLQDDLAVIANKIKAREGPGGDGFRPDDFAAAMDPAVTTPLADAGDGLLYASGIIERMSDVDAFSFVSAGDGRPLVIAAVPDAPSGLDAKLEIYDDAGNRLATRDAATNEQQLTMTLPAGTYYALVSSHGDYGDVGTYDLSVRPLPDGWNSADVGSIGAAVGFTQFDPATGLFTNAGGGTAIGGTADSFHFGYQTLTGNGEIVARVTQNQNTNAAAKIGLMIRDGSAGNAKHAAIVINPAGQAQFLARGSAGGSTTTATGSTAALPRWLRLTRVNNLLTGYASADGTAWTQVGQATVPMAATVSIGLATTAGTAGKLNRATLDGVTITGDTTAAAPPTYNALPAPANVAAAPAASGPGLTFTWDTVPGATGYAVQRSSDGVTFAQVGTTAGDATTTYTDPNPGASMRYYYRVAARDASGDSAPSAAASAVNRPPAPSNLAVTAWNQTNLILNWKDVSGDAGYRVERSADGGQTWAPLATVGTNVPSYTHAGLTAATAYTYRVVTLSAAGDSAPSAAATGSTRLAAVTGTAIDGAAPTGVTFRWNDLTNESGYRIERSTDGTAWSTLANVPANHTTYTDATVTRLKEYYYRVFGTAGQAISLNPAYAFTATPDATPLPAPWVSGNVGTVQGTGAAGFASGTFTLISAGNQIDSTADNFRFTYQPLVGDGEIVARIAAIEDTDASAKVGVMIRASTAANAPYAAVLNLRGGGMRMQSRATAGGATTTTAGTGTVFAPYWVRLVRAGNVFTGYQSPDGANWTQVSQVTLANVPPSALVGLALSSRVSNELNTATVTNVTVSNAPPTVATPARANPSPVTAGNTATLTVVGADDHGEPALKYTWAATALPAGAAAPTLAATNGTNAGKTLTATFLAPGDYAFTVTITDAAGASTTSTVAVTVSTAFPAVTATEFDHHNRLRVTFNNDVGASLSADALKASPLAGGPDLAPTGVTWDPATRTATFTFATDFADGDYRATVSAAGIEDAAGLPMPADAAFDFFAMLGDITGDRRVDFDDLVVIAQNYDAPTGQTFATGDLTGDGAVDFNDLTLLAQRYDQALPPPLMPVAPPAEASPASPPAAAAEDDHDRPPFSTRRIPPAKPKPLARARRV
jgi:regulation of enolase protein 1 (concanavalin A-like superfamily)